MIFLNETVARKREVYFDLQDSSSNAITGHAFVDGEILIQAPGGVLGHADVTRIAEIGNGTYALQLTDAQVSFAGAGVVQVAAALAAAQPLHYPFTITDPADITSAGGGGGGTALPAGPVTLTEIINIVRLRGDYLSSLTYTNPYLTSEIQAAWTETYELMAGAHQGYWDKSSNISTVAAQAYVALPSDYWRVQAIDILDGNEWRPLRQVGMKDRNRFGAASAEPLAYRLSVRGAELFPTPNVVYTLRVSYTPIVTTLDDSGVQLFGWEEHIIVGALLRLDQRSEKPLGERQSELQRCTVRLIGAANERKSSEPELLNLHLHDGDDEFDGYNPGGY